MSSSQPRIDPMTGACTDVARPAGCAGKHPVKAAHARGSGMHACCAPCQPGKRVSSILARYPVGGDQHGATKKQLTCQVYL